jgi:hypothetical protein
MKSIFLKKGVILIMEMIHQAEKFSSFGAFNGFPFLLSEKTEYLSEANSGICTESKKSIVPSGRELETTVNHYWNLGSVELSFAIKTTAAPEAYETGFAYDEDLNNSAGPTDDNQVFIGYEVVRSTDEEPHPPQSRIFKEVTGEKEIQFLDEDGIIVGSGREYSSCILSDEPDFYMPITVQPENTGAFVITTDSGVASYFENDSDFGSCSKFKMNMMLDFGKQLFDENGDEWNNIEYCSFPVTGYIVPKQDWEFEIKGSKAKGFYYEYPFNETVKNNNETFNRKIFRKQIISKAFPPKFISDDQDNELLDEPLPSESSEYVKTNSYSSVIGGSSGEQEPVQSVILNGAAERKMSNNYRSSQREVPRGAVYNKNAIEANQRNSLAFSGSRRYDKRKAPNALDKRFGPTKKIRGVDGKIRPATCTGLPSPHTQPKPNWTWSVKLD